jgi:hypothetical protein
MGVNVSLASQKQLRKECQYPVSVTCQSKCMTKNHTHNQHEKSALRGITPGYN